MEHLLRILEIQHLRGDEVLWENKDIDNTFHLEGEQFILSTVFCSSAGITIPSFFYVGMDNRTEVDVTDNMLSVTTEPTGNGYTRKPVSSSTGFTVEEYSSGGEQHWRAKSQIVSFSASGSQWGPVSNVFLTDRSDNAGYLISTAPLGTTRNIKAGESINFRFSLSLINND